MNTKRWSRCRGGAWLAVVSLCLAAPQWLAGQVAPPITSSTVQAGDAAAFKEFSVGVQAYLKLQKTVASSLPALKPTDVPELITAYQQALARKVREARPDAKAGDIFTPAACQAFRRASRAALQGPNSATTRAYMKPDAPDPGMALIVNGIYPDTEPITALPPELLAAFPPLPADVAYRVVGRTLIVIDVKSRLIVDVAHSILPPAS